MGFVFEGEPPLYEGSVEKQNELVLKAGIVVWRIPIHVEASSGDGRVPVYALVQDGYIFGLTEAPALSEEGISSIQAMMSSLDTGEFTIVDHHTFVYDLSQIEWWYLRLALEDAYHSRTRYLTFQLASLNQSQVDELIVKNSTPASE